MYTKFKRHSKVLVYGYGESTGKFYRDEPAIVLERDSYYGDYLVRFNNNTEDWILPKYLRRPYEKKSKKKKRS